MLLTWLGPGSAHAAESSWRHRYGAPTSLDFSSVACLEIAQYQLLWAAVGERGSVLLSSNILDKLDTRWTWVESGTEDWIRDIAAGGKQFLAAGDKGTLLIGFLPGSWRRITNAPRANWTGVARGKDRWAVISDEGSLISVDDLGQVSVLPSIPITSPKFFTSLRYGGGRYLASGTRGSLFLSPDLSRWTDKSLNTPETLSRPQYGSGQWCIAAGFQFHASVDGDQWTDAGSLPRGITITDLAHREGSSVNIPAWVAVGDGGASYYSSDLRQWYQFRNSYLETDLTAISFCLGAWTAVGNRGTYWLGSLNPAPPAADGLIPNWWVNWGAPQVNRLASPIPESTSIAVGDTFILGMGLPQWSLLQPRSGTEASFLSTGILSPLNQVRRFGGRLMAVGDEGGIFLGASTAGVWRPIPPNVGRSSDLGSFVNSTENLNGIDAHGEARLCVGEHGTIRRSTDGGSTWYGMSCPTDASLQGIRYGGGRWVAVGEHETLLGSDDGIHWSLLRGRPHQPSDPGDNPDLHPDHWIPSDPAFDPWGTDDWSSVYRFTLGTSGITYNAVDWNECLWVAVGDQGAVTTSTDGIHWSEPIHITTQTLRSVRGQGGRWMAVGDDGDAYLSQDGQTWSRTHTHSRSRLTAIDVAGDEWVVGGNGWTLLMSAIGPPAPTSTTRLQAHLEWNATQRQWECVLRWPRIPHAGSLHVSESVDGPFESIEVEALCGQDFNEFRAPVVDTLSAFYILRSP